MPQQPPTTLSYAQPPPTQSQEPYHCIQLHGLDEWVAAMQVAEAKAAGAAGVMGVIASVTGPRGTPVLSSFAAAIGLDTPVEVQSVCLVHV